MSNMWRILRQTFLGKWSIRQVPPASANQADTSDTKWSPFSSCRKTCHRSYELQEAALRYLRCSAPQQVCKPSLPFPSLAIGYHFLAVKLAGQSIIKSLCQPSSDLNKVQLIGFEDAEKPLEPNRPKTPSPTQLKTPERGSSVDSVVEITDQVDSVDSVSRCSVKSDVRQTSYETEDLLKKIDGLMTDFSGLVENQSGFEAASLRRDCEAFEHFRRSAESSGCPQAHYNLGVCYESGRGTAQNLHRAAHHYAVATQARHAAALYNLGIFYLHGLGGLMPSETMALRLIRRAAHQDLPEALVFLGVRCHERGDPSKGAQYFVRASRQQSAEAQYFLGLSYHHGWGVEADSRRALDCLASSAAAGHADAARWLERLRPKPLHFSHSSSELPQLAQDSRSPISRPSPYLDLAAIAL